ncbi:MAG: MBOAT family protein [Tannerellaceae bacterium]|jgi:D-alanyl-lipoteichoic acid acyltransferase DltB (MBOAT superfamily)|nr:MBOAT family protein [Tannerellaceae bacterium]
MEDLINELLHKVDLPALVPQLSWHKLCEEFMYRPEAPMLFSSGLFMFLFIAFLAIYIPLRKHLTARLIYVVLFSVFFYYKSSGLWFVLLLCTATSDFIIGRRLSLTVSRPVRKLLVAVSLCVNLGMLAYFKYFNFIVDAFVRLGHEVGHLLGMTELEALAFEPADIFLPVGISFFTFQSLSYIIEIYRRRIDPVYRWIDYIFYVSFFPQLVAGPIVRAREFIPQIYRTPSLSRAHFGEGLFLIICGLIKKAVISDYISLNFVDRIFDAPLLYTGLENLIGVYGYALQIYCDFSGYSDMAIGLALLLGFRFSMNFDSPYCSASITEFWRRWHISLSSWLRDYLYISLGGNRKGRLRTYVNLLLTMLLGGLWHGASMRFILWGGIHGVALAVDKFLMGRFRKSRREGAKLNPVRRLAGILITFHVVCFGWIFFRADSMQTTWDILNRIALDFHPEILPQFVEGYKTVVALMLAGYLFHFMPRRVEGLMQSIVTRSPLLVQAIILVAVIFVIVQMKSAGVQPFIYFQF